METPRCGRGNRRFICLIGKQWSYRTTHRTNPTGDNEYNDIDIMGILIEFFHQHSFGAYVGHVHDAAEAGPQPLAATESDVSLPPSLLLPLPPPLPPPLPSAIATTCHFHHLPAQELALAIRSPPPHPPHRRPPSHSNPCSCTMPRTTSTEATPSIRRMME